jgi:cysteinyl-tRNA synthetase
MRLYNTLTRAIEEVRPAHPDGVFRMYECGMTPSGEPHIGHARTAVVFDTMRRWMKFRGMKLRHVRNVTDIEDKIIKKAADEGIEPAAVVAKYDAVRRELFGRLNLLPPDVEPYATQVIPEIIEVINRLVENGLAYAAGGDVYYRVRKFPAYGKLSRNTIDKLVSGSRVQPEAHVEDPLDFALWKGEKPGEPAWDSPWGRGRPGWHIECSAMAMKYLGETLDLHGGGNDLIFPHHENEIAQSEGATGKPFARIWSHPGWVTLNQEKMSKSVGNTLPLRTVVDRLDPPALRLLMGQTHYRTPFEWSDDAERQAVETLKHLERQLDLSPAGEAAAHKDGDGAAAALEAESAVRLAAFDAAMDDDLGTPRALAELFSLASRFAAARDGHPGAVPFIKLKTVRDAILARLDAMGIALEFRKDGLPPDLQPLLAERATARKERNWARADEIRKAFAAQGWTIEDTGQGQVARKA